MSQKRQPVSIDPRTVNGAHIAAGSWDFRDGHIIPRHTHRQNQLLFASHGVMTVDTPEGVWVVPPLRAVWLPANTLHGVAMSGRVSMRTLYLAPAMCRALPRTCTVINVSALLRELILHACTFPMLNKRVVSQRHVIGLIVDQLKVMESIPMQLPHPRDARALRLVRYLFSEPSDQRPLAALSAECGASKRTMQRLFSEEAGMSFSKWRQRLRLITAMQRLAAGESVTNAALESGYSTASAFISMFRKQLGTTPARYLAGNEDSFQAPHS